MRRGVVCGILGGILLAAAAGQAAEQRLLTRDELSREADENDALEQYLDRNGVPDVAETRPLADEGPWDDHEVVLYYLDARREIAFARAAILSTSDVYVRRLERPLTDEDLTALKAAPKLGTAEEEETAEVAPPPVQTAALDAGAAEEGASEVDLTDVDPTDPVARAEAAATRAERAADLVENAAARTERAAARAEAVVEKMLARSR